MKPEPRRLSCKEKDGWDELTGESNKSPDEPGNCTFTVRGNQLKIHKMRDYLEH